MKIPSQKELNFIDDILTYKPVAKLLYSASAEKEIQLLKSIKNPFASKSLKHKLKIPKKEKTNKIKCDEEKKKYIKKVIDDENQKIKMERINKFRKRNLFQRVDSSSPGKRNQRLTQLEICKSEILSPLNQQRTKSFNRILNNCMEKGEGLHLSKNPSSPKILKGCLTPRERKKKVPDIKLNIEDVYSRLYHNKVFLENYENSVKPTKKRRKIRNSTFGLTEQEKEEILIKKRLFNKANLKVSNVINSTSGREFTLKITPEIFLRCLKKHSGGPKVIIDEEENTYAKNDNEESDGLLRLTTLLDNCGNSVLHRAVASNQVEFVNYFLEKDVNPNCQNYEGDTPLHLAMEIDNHPIIEALFDKGADILVQNNDRKTPYDYASDAAKRKFNLDHMYTMSLLKAKK